MYSLCNSEDVCSKLLSIADSACQVKGSCDSHISIYYEQKQQEEELTQEQPTDTCRKLDISKSLPVEIHEEETTSIELPPLIWHGYENPPKLLSVTNTGRTILINGHWMNSRPYIEGGPLNGNYLFSQIHFHCPSEHEIDGRRYPLEMHLVHYKTSYLTQERAMSEKDGTVVLVYLFRLMEQRHSAPTPISQITKLAPQLDKMNARTETNEIFLDEMIKPFFSNYYVYWGSVCSNKNAYLLQWIISCALLEVTQEEVDDLSNIIASAGLIMDKQITRSKPICDAVFHVGDDDYEFPPLKTTSISDVVNVCRCQELGCPACDAEWRNDTCPKHGGKGKKSKKKKNSKGKSKGKDKDGALSCESTNGSSRSSVRDDKSDKKKKKKKKEKKSKKTKRSGDYNSDSECDCESGKSSSKSLVCDDIKKKSKKRSNKKETRPDSELGSECQSSKSSASSIPEKRPKKTRQTQTIEMEELDCDEENEKADEDEEFAKKKKKKNKKANKESKSRTENPSRESVRVNADCFKVSSITPILLSPKSSVCDYDRKGVKNDIQDCEIKALSNCAITLRDSSSSDSCDSKKKVQANTCGDVIVESSGVLSFIKSKCPVNMKLFSNSECREPQIKMSKARAMEDNECCETASSKSRPSLCVGSQSEMGRSKTERAATCTSKSVEEMQSMKKANAGKICEPNSKPSKERKRSNNKLDNSCNQVMFRSKEDVRGNDKAGRKSKEDVKKINKACSKSREDVKGTTKARSKSREDVKKSNKAVNKSKEDVKKCNKAGSKSKENVRRSNKAVNKSKENVRGNSRTSLSDCKDDIMTLYEKKQVCRKVENCNDDCNDVQINFLLTPCTKATSNPSCTITTSESDFIEEKKVVEDLKETTNFIVQNFTVDTAAIPDSEVPADKLKKDSQVCLLMEHLFRSENKEGQVYKCNSQEYNVAIICDQNVLQEYKGKFHPQELQVGNDEILQLVPKYPELEDSSIRLQDCTVKKESLDQFCIRVKFLLKELNFRRIFTEMENGLTKIEEKNERKLFDEETQYSCFGFDISDNLCSKSPEENENVGKVIDSERTEISNIESKSKIDDVMEETQPTADMLSSLKEEVESQKCTIKLEQVPDICSQDVSRPSDAEEDLKETNTSKDKSGENIDKKLKPLFVKRRKTVYFMYDKVEKDESTGKKVFVGSFRTKEEVDNLKKQKELLEEKEAVSTSGNSTETPEAKHDTSCSKKEADLEVKKSAQSPKSKGSSPGRKCPPTSKGAPANKKNDLVTLHKYKPKYSGLNRTKKDCKNVLIGKAVNSLQKESENLKNFNEKAPKITPSEVQEAKESELQKEIPEPGTSKSENKSKTKNVSLVTNQGAHSEVIVPEKSNKAEEDSAVDDRQRSLDKNESQAGLVLIPVEVESLSKTEVILIEHLNDLKKNKKEDERTCP